MPRPHLITVTTACSADQARSNGTCPDVSRDFMVTHESLSAANKSKVVESLNSPVGAEEMRCTCVPGGARVQTEEQNKCLGATVLILQPFCMSEIPFFFP